MTGNTNATGFNIYTNSTTIITLTVLIVVPKRLWIWKLGMASLESRPSRLERNYPRSP